MWYTTQETNADVPIPGVDDYDPKLFEAKEVAEGRYLIITHEGTEPTPISYAVPFDHATAIIRWIRDNGLRDYRRAIVLGSDPRGVCVLHVRDLSTVKSDRHGQRGMVIVRNEGQEDVHLGSDLPFEHAYAVADWLTGSESYEAA